MASILLVEDEPWFGELYVQLLGKEHEVQWCRDAETAMTCIDQQRPDIVVLDVLLWGANGIQLLHELVSYSDTARVPVVLFSAALPRNLDATTFASYGVVATLDKTTVKPSQVVKTINGVLKVHANH